MRNASVTVTAIVVACVVKRKTDGSKSEFLSNAFSFAVMASSSVDVV